MRSRMIPGQLIVTNDPAAAASEGAARIEDALRRGVAARGRATLALSGGNTPRDAYATVAHASGLDWTKVHVYWVDERAVPPDDDRSNYRWAKSTLLDGAAIPPAQVHRMPADAPDLDAAARAYEKSLAEAVEPAADGVPVFDVVVLGVGEDGHTASLFPGERTVDIVNRLVVAVPARPGREARLTLTRPVIQRSRSVIVLAVGGSKREALARAWALDGDIHETPSRLVRECRGEVVWIVDRAAAEA